MKRRSGEVLTIEIGEDMWFFKNFSMQKGVINGDSMFPLLDELDYRNVEMLKATFLQINNLPISNMVWSYE